jgi:hypothetical protein
LNITFTVGTADEADNVNDIPIDAIAENITEKLTDVFTKFISYLRPVYEDASLGRIILVN